MEFYPMLKLLKPKHSSLLGIDIGSSSVKILEISGNAENYCLENYASGLFPPNTNIIKNQEAVICTIKHLLENSHFTTQLAAIAVPDSAVISKIVQVNRGLKESEIEEFIYIEVEKFIPYPLHEINLDFVILGPSLNNQTLLDVRIIASRAEQVNHRLEVISRAGLVVKIVDVKSYAIERVVKLMPDDCLDKTIAIIEIGAVYTHLFVLDKRKMIFNREEEFGGNLLLESFKESVSLQVKRILHFFYSSANYALIDYIFLAGGVAKEADLSNLLQQNLGIPVKFLNPFQNMSMRDSINREIVNREAPLLMTACGLALRRIE